jgi:hypothetical protein
LSTHQPLSAKNTGKYDSIEAKKQLEAQWAEPVSLTFHSALRKLNTFLASMLSYFPVFFADSG